jgi:hypothetical protein
VTPDADPYNVYTHPLDPVDAEEAGILLDDWICLIVRTCPPTWTDAHVLDVVARANPPWRIMRALLAEQIRGRASGILELRKGNL